MYISVRKSILIVAFLLYAMNLSACGRSGPVLERITETDGQVSSGVSSDRSRNGITGESGTSPDGNAGESGASQSGNSDQGSRSDGGQTERKISVFVCGAVVNPGVYLMPASSRAVDAVDAAGGFTEEADREWCNLARLLSDGEKLVIYTEEQTKELRENGQKPEGEASSTSLQAGSPSASGGLVNINACDQNALMTLPGIGETRANAIISYRNTHGNFAAPEDIMLVPGIKESIYSQIKDRITVG